MSVCNDSFGCAEVGDFMVKSLRLMRYLSRIESLALVFLYREIRMSLPITQWGNTKVRRVSPKKWKGVVLVSKLFQEPQHEDPGLLVSGNTY
jgi:hypothetical protein